MFSRYVFYKGEKGKKTLKVWGAIISHEDYMKQHNILQTQEGTSWQKVISMGYLRLDLDKECLFVVPLLNKDERYVGQYLQQIKVALEELYPHTPKMKSIVRQEVSILSVAKAKQR